MDDSVQIKCNRCKNVFRDRATRLRNGYSRQCPSCEVVLFFDEDSQQPNIKSAMRAARLLRKQLREHEGVGAFGENSSAARSRRYSGRGRSEARADD
jgi:predicted  nucleic acid-binding Zn-ribbon protein